MTIDLQAKRSCSQLLQRECWPVIGSPTPKETWLWHVAIWGRGVAFTAKLRTACACPLPHEEIARSLVNHPMLWTCRVGKKPAAPAPTDS